jgi:membrane-bound lytic murein transglycosylase D
LKNLFLKTLFVTIIVFSFSCSKQKFQKKRPVLSAKDSLSLLIEEAHSLHENAEFLLANGDTVNAENKWQELAVLLDETTEKQKKTLSKDSVFIAQLRQVFFAYENILDEEHNEVVDSLSAFDFLRFYIEDGLKTGQLDLSEISKESDSLDINISELIKDSNLPEYVIPLTMNKKVKRHLNYFLKNKRGRKTMQIWLKRGSKYKDIIQNILKEEGLPQELYYLAMIESGFNLRARSWAKAVGPWQFMKATGKAYGLKATYWADDRKDIEKSTRAAARHLRDLNNRFGDWYLALAGYNCNPAKIARQVRRQKTKDYFKLERIPRETKGYVPQFIAAMMIGENPEKYGFNPEISNPIQYDRIYLKDVVDLHHIAKASKVSFSKIKELNPAINKWVTPSDRDSMYVNVPLGFGEVVKNYVDSLPKSEKQKFFRYKIKSGDALSLIAQKYRVRMKDIRKLNKMSSNNIRAGKYLIIPVPADKKYLAKISIKEKRVKKKRKKQIVGYNRIIHKVKHGHTLGHIAEKYFTHAKKIRKWNGLRFRQHIRVGQNLVLYIKKGRKPLSEFPVERLNHSKYEYHKIRSGDTLWEIAQKYNLNIKELKKINNLHNSTLRAGKHLIIRIKKAE